MITTAKRSSPFALLGLHTKWPKVKCWRVHTRNTCYGQRAERESAKKVWSTKRQPRKKLILKRLFFLRPSSKRQWIVIPCGCRFGENTSYVCYNMWFPNWFNFIFFLFLFDSFVGCFNVIVVRRSGQTTKTTTESIENIYSNKCTYIEHTARAHAIVHHMKRNLPFNNNRRQNEKRLGKKPERERDTWISQCRKREKRPQTERGL